VAPPQPGGPRQTLYVLDGQALWRVTVGSAGRARLPDAAAGPMALRLEAEADPIRYDGVLDEADRTRRRFVLWLADDPSHLPLRLEMPIGIGDLVVALVEIERTAAVR
jgi:hypothetical protein